MAGNPVFPHNGKTFSDFSIQWKNFEEFFHSVEKSFPHYGKIPNREPPYPGRRFRTE